MKLKLATSNNKESSRQEIAMAEIEQEHRGSKWTPIDARETGRTLPIDEILEKSNRTLEGLVGKQ